MADDERSRTAGQPFATDEGAADAQAAPKEPRGAWLVFDRLVVVAFAVALVLPAILLVARVQVAQIENRPLRSFPTLSVGGLADATWPVGVDGFVTDHLWPRPYAIRVRGEVYWLSGGTGNPDVIRGVDDWLFDRPELQPDCSTTAAQQAAAVGRASARLAEKGIELRILVVPDKHAVYPDKLPPDNPFPPSCVDTNRAQLDAAFAALDGVAIDATAVLQAARATPGSTDVYYAGDSHWTPAGAVAAIGELVRSFGPDVWSAADIGVSGTKRRELDLPVLLGLERFALTPRVVVRTEVRQHQADVPVPVAINNARAVFRITCSGSDRLLVGRTLVVYDSFFGIDQELVAPYFAESTWVPFADLQAHPDLGRLLGPFDRVIVERVARGFYSMDVDAMLARIAEAPNG